MGLDILQGLAEVFVAAIPLIVVGAGALLLLSRSRLGEAVARRIAGDAPNPGYHEQLDALQDELAGLRNQLSEVQERVDFAERLLGRGHRPLAGIVPGRPCNYTALDSANRSPTAPRSSQWHPFPCWKGLVHSTLPQ